VLVSFAEIYRTLSIYFSLFFQLITQKPKLMHLCCALSTVGVFRDTVCVVLARLFRVPVVIHYHGNVQDFRGARFAGLSGKTLRFLLQNADMNIVANTPSLLTCRQLLGEENNKVVLLPNFIEDSIFQRAKKSRTDHPLRAIYAGGIPQAKGCAEILTMAGEFPHIEFHLYGKMHADMVEIYQAAPDNLHLHGEVPHTQLLSAMCEADFLLFPSYTEGFPLTVLEAMSVGLPVVSTSVGGIPEMICHGKGGFLVNPRETTDLADAIRNLTHDASLLAQMGQYNQQKSYDTYRYSIVMAQLIEIYNLILAGAEKCVA
jgi:glycosyltransferase involved in cell wall biosynthesis